MKTIKVNGMPISVENDKAIRDVLLNMKVGEFEVFTRSQRGSVRSIASLLKKDKHLHFTSPELGEYTFVTRLN